ncbi:MAG: 16S rRNA (uracil(1498)-N(3))-methyltransferase [Myxococcales bacterium]
MKRRLHVPPEQLGRGNPVALTPAQAHYLETVLRLRPGSPVEVFDGQGRRFDAVLESAGLQIGAELPRAAQSALDVWLAQAIVKGDKLDLVVQKATELGASRIVLLDTARSVVKLEDKRAASRLERLRRVAEEAARQCGRSDVPPIDGPLSFDELPSRLEPDRLGLLLDAEEGELRLSQAARGAARLCLAVGPEGGFAEPERERAVSEGMLRVTLGRLVLRTETAGLAALAVVRHLAGDLG